jgi:hypothetical protein
LDKVELRHSGKKEPLVNEAENLVAFLNTVAKAIHIIVHTQNKPAARAAAAKVVLGCYPWLPGALTDIKRWLESGCVDVPTVRVRIPARALPAYKHPAGRMTWVERWTYPSEDLLMYRGNFFVYDRERKFVLPPDREQKLVLHHSEFDG